MTHVDNRVSDSIVGCFSQCCDPLDYLYDNVFVDEIQNGSGAREAIGSGTAIAMVRLQQYSSQIHIDGNTFSHVPTAVALIGRELSDIWISHNRIFHWRQRGIYTVNDGPIASEEIGRGTITDVHVVHNIIGPPKHGAIRQPIAAQVRVVSEHKYQRLEISFNKIYSPDLAYDRNVVNNATRDSVSVHGAENFSVRGNCIINGGEVGITIALGSRDGVVSEII